MINVPEVFAVVEVPGRGMADHIPSICGFLQHGLVPKLRRHFDQTQRGEKLLGHPEHVSSIITLWIQMTLSLSGALRMLFTHQDVVLFAYFINHGVCHIYIGLVRKRDHHVVDVVPRL